MHDISLHGSGPFISGTRHKLLALGQAVPVPAPPPGQTAGVKRKQRPPPERPGSDYAPPRSPAGPTTSAKSKGGAGSPTLLDMIQAGVLRPGVDNAVVTYKGATHAGSLQSNGTILFRGQEFATPSAFSVHVKRLVTPAKQGDDGWHSVCVDGTMLHQLRVRFQQQQQQQLPQQQAVPALPPLPTAPKRQGATSKPPGQQQQPKQPRPAKPVVLSPQVQQARSLLKMHLPSQPPPRPQQPQPPRQQQPQPPRPQQQQQQQPAQRPSQPSAQGQPIIKQPIIKKLKLGKVHLPAPKAGAGGPSGGPTAAPSASAQPSGSTAAGGGGGAVSGGGLGAQA